MPDLDIKINIIAKDAASNALKGVATNTQDLGKAVLAGLGAATGAITGVGVALADLAIKAAPLVDLRGAFEGFTKSLQGGSEAMLDALKKASGGMIETADLMKSFNTAAQLVSIDFAQRLPDAMGALGKVAAATGQDLDFLLQSLVTGIGRLSPMILDNLGIQVDLTKAYEDYANAIGVSVDELSKSQQQTALMNQVMEKLASNTADLPDPTKGVAAMWQRLKVQLAEARAEMGIRLLPVMEVVIERLAEIANIIIPKVLAAIDKLVPILIQIARVFSVIIKRVLWGADVFDALAFGMKKTTAFGSPMIGTFLRFAISLKGTVTQILTLVKSFVNFIKNTVSIQNALRALAIAVASVFVPMIAQAATMVATFFLLVAAVKRVRQFISSELGRKTIAVIRQVIEFVRFLFSVIMSGLGVFEILEIVMRRAFGNVFVNRILSIIGAVKLFINTVTNAIRPLIEWVTENINLGDIVRKIAGFIAGKLIPALGGLLTTLAPVIAVIGGLVLAFFALRKQIVKAFSSEVAKIVSRVMGFIQTFFDRVRDGEQPLDVLISMIDELTGGALTMAIGKIEEIITKLTEFKDEIWEMIAPIVNWIIENVKLTDILAGLAAVLIAAVIPGVIAFLTAAWPIIALFLGVVAIIALFRKAMENDVLGMLEERFPAAAEFVKQVIEVLKATFASIVTVWETQIAPALQATWDQIKESIEGLQPTFEKLKIAFAAIGVVIGTVVVAVVGIIVGLVTAIATALPALIDTFANVFMAVVEILDGVVQFVMAFVNLIIDIFDGGGVAWKEHLGAIWEAIKQIFINTLRLIWSILSGAFNVITNLVDGFIKGFIGFFEFLQNELVGNSIIPDMINAIIKVFQFMAKTVLKVIEIVVGGLIDVLMAAAQFLIDFFLTTFTNGIQLVIDLFKKLPDPIRDVADIILGVLSLALGTIIDLFDGFKRGLDAVVFVINLIITAIKNLGAALGDLELPDDLLPGSPPPFAVGLAEIARQMRDLQNSAIPGLQAAFGGLQATLPVGAAAGAGGGAGGPTTENNFNLTINTDTVQTGEVIQDFEALRSLVGTRG